MKNNYKALIIIILLFSLLFILLLIFINEDSNNDINSDSGVVNPTPEDDTEESGNVIIKGDINNFDNMLDNIELNKLDYVKDYDYFFTVNDIVNRYLGFNYANQGEVNYLIDDYTFGNVESLNKLYRDNDYTEFVVDSMKVYDNGIIQNYFVSGYLAISGMDGVERQEKAVFVVRIDKAYQTYSIIPSSFTTIDNVFANYGIADKKENILKNDYNQYELVSISANRLAYIYLAGFVNEMAFYPDEAYNKLDDKIKNTVFKTKEDFEKFLNVNMEKIYNYKIENIIVSHDNLYTIYEIETDNYTYTFKMKYIMDYEVSIE